MNKAELRGTGKVFSFTLAQHFKSKATKVTLIIFAVLALASMPVLSVFFASPKQDSSCSIGYVAFENSTPYQLCAADLAAQDGRFEKTEDFDLGQEECINSVIVTVAQDADGLAVHARSYKYTTVTAEDMDALTAAVQSAVLQQQLRLAGAEPESSAFSFDTFENYDREETDVNTTMGVSYTYSIIVMMLTIISASYIIRAVIEEKTSKLVELLTVSVRPMALMVGKVLAMAVVVFTVVIGLGVMAGVSYLITSTFRDMSFVAAGIESAGITEAFSGLAPVTLIGVIITMLLAYAFFAFLGGLSGACCSGVEDSGNAMTTSMILIMGSYLFAVMVPAFDARSLYLFGCICPVLSGFTAPAAFVSGDISLGILAIGWVLQLAAIVILIRFTARVYEALLMHRGKRIGMKQLFRLAKRGE